MKNAQKISVWLLPLIVIGGSFYPLLGYLVVAMMAVLLTLALFKGRYWCSNLCPRGAFLDIVISRASRRRPFPALLVRPWFRWTVFYLFMGIVLIRLITSGGKLSVIGAVFVSMCVVTTIIAALAGMLSRHRCWCAFCPMGTLQDKIGRSSPFRQEVKNG